MHNRWCIISGPRSGSTWLENSIYEYLKAKDNIAQKLLEFIHLNNVMLLDSVNNIRIFEIENRHLNSFDEKLQTAYRLIENANVKQSLTCRVFNENYFTSSEYLDFFLHLQKYGFKFINLERDLLDRAISLYFAIETGVWHRIKDSHLSTNTDTKLLVDLPKIVDYYLFMHKSYILRQQILNNLPHVVVNYKTSYQDLKLHNIPFKEDTNLQILKTYEKPYKDLIINYDEVINMINILKNNLPPLKLSL